MSRRHLLKRVAATTVLAACGPVVVEMCPQVFDPILFLDDIVSAGMGALPNIMTDIEDGSIERAFEIRGPAAANLQHPISNLLLRWEAAIERAPDWRNQVHDALIAEMSRA